VENLSNARLFHAVESAISQYAMFVLKKSDSSCKIKIMKFFVHRLFFLLKLIHRLILNIDIQTDIEICELNKKYQ
jgi:hypothetical protein